MTKFCSILLNLTFVFHLMGATVNASSIVAGPESHGLRLRLSSNGDSNHVALEIRNSSQHDVILLSRFENFSEEISASVSWLTYPPVTAGQQQEVADGDTPVYGYKLTIKAGESLSFDFKEPRHFPTPGLYQVHAQIVIRKDDGAKVFLRSNECPISVGKSLLLPKHTVAEVLSVNPANRTALIDLGDLHGIERGDVFRIIPSMILQWKLEVISIWDDKAEAQVEIVTNDEKWRQKFPESVFPKKGQRAILYSD